MKKSDIFWQTYLNLEKEAIEVSKYIFFTDEVLVNGKGGIVAQSCNTQLETFSPHIADLLVRCCVQIEAISKELYFDNGGTPHPIRANILLYTVFPFFIPILTYILNFNVRKGFFNADTSVKKLNILIESNNFNTESAFLGVNENEAINNALIRYLFSVRNLLSSVVCAQLFLRHNKISIIFKNGARFDNGKLKSFKTSLRTSSCK